MAIIQLGWRDEECDVCYLPEEIANKMPQIFEIPMINFDDPISETSSNPRRITPTEMGNSFALLSAVCFEYYKVLNDFGINHNDSETMANFFNDKALMDAVHAKFDKIV